MKPLLTTLYLCISVTFCFSQNEQSTQAYPSAFVAGVSVQHVLSSSEVRRYSLNSIQDGYYSDISDKHRSSLLVRFKGEFQFAHLFVRGGLGIRTERTNLEAYNIQEYYSFAPGQNYNAEIHRNLHINEKTTSLILSIEAGSYFLRRDRPFRVGMGVGFDFCAYLDSKSIGLNQLNKEERILNPTFPDVYNAITTTHTKGSEEWQTVVRDVSMPIVVPKISLKASYRLYENLSVSVQTGMRLLVLNPELQKATFLAEFPIGIGVHYHFAN